MNFPLLTAYVLAVLVLLATPGPVVALITATAARDGRRRAFATLVGTNSASLALMLLAIFIGLAVAPFAFPGVKALENVNLTVEQGDIYGIIGMSGAGKSTLVRCLNFLEKPTEGQVLIEGQELGALTEKELRGQRSDIAMIFQNFNLIDELSVYDNIELPLLYNKLHSFERKKKVEDIAAILGISHRLKHFPY